MTVLRDQLEFQQLVDLCGVDYPERAERFDVVYHLLSMTKNRRARLKVQTDVNVPILYGDVRVEEGVTIPMIVSGLVAVSVHSIENLTQFYDQQMQAILRVSGLPLGIVVNFSVPSVRGAMHRIMNPNPRV